MKKIATVDEVRASFNDYLADVQEGNSVTITQDGEQIAVMIGWQEYERIRRERVDSDWVAIDELRRRNDYLDPDEVLREVTEVVEEVRQERYEKERRVAQTE